MLPFYDDVDAQSAVFLFLSTEKIADTPHIERDVIGSLIFKTSPLIVFRLIFGTEKCDTIHNSFQKDAFIPGKQE